MVFSKSEVSMTQQVNESSKLSRQQIIRNRVKLLAIMAVFALPVIVAYAGFWGGWFSDVNRTNKGELMQPTIDINGWHLLAGTEAYSTGQQWWLILVLDAEMPSCDAVCERHLFTLQQTWLALGKNQDRVQASVLGNVPTDKVSTVVKTLARGENAPHITPSFYIVDPLGNVILRYALPNTEQEAIDRAKAMRTDFAKLMRFSRVG